jgi:hypothetical protein
MKAEKKAKELFDKYYVELKEHKGYYDLETAKQCALIAVDEILKVSLSYAGKDYEFYQEVKQEIEKI